MGAKNDISNKREEGKLESRIGNPSEMKFWTTFKSIIPSIFAGTAASMGCQEVVQRYTENPEIITGAGMIGQFVVSYAAFFPSYLIGNSDRLIKNGKIEWRRYAQEVGSVIASDRVGNCVWAGTYALVNEIFSRGVNPTYAATISGILSGISYATFTSTFAPKVNSLIDKIKGRVKKKNLSFQS